MGRYDDSQPKSPVAAIVGVTAALIAAVAVWWLVAQEDSDNKPAVNELPLPPANIAPELPAAELSPPVTDEPGQTDDSADIEENSQPKDYLLPELKDSDGWVRLQLIDLSPNLADLVQSDGLIDKYLKIVNDFSEGRRPYKHMKFLSLPEAFAAAKDEQGLYMPERNYHRYDRFAQAFAAIDAKQAMTVFRELRPLLLQVYADFSYPAEYQLEDLFKKAAAEVIAAPVVEGRIALLRHAVRYKYADQKLEALSPVQKQMLRMGPENTRIVQKKLREIVQAMSALQGD